MISLCTNVFVIDTTRGLYKASKKSNEGQVSKRSNTNSVTNVSNE
jgi:hypothetical protein